MIRILMVYGGLNRGGSETAMMNVYRRIDRTKIQFDFISHSLVHIQYAKEIQSLGGKVFFFPKYKLFNHFFYINYWKKFLSNNNSYNVIHIHYYSIAGIVLKLFKQKSIFSIVHSHTANIKGIVGLIIRIINFNTYRNATFLLACSSSAGQWLFGKKVLTQRNFFIVNNGLEVNNFLFNPLIREKVRDKFLFEGKIILGHVGRFTKAKNHIFLVKLFSKLVQINPNLRLFLIGDGELKISVFRIIEKLKMQSFITHISNTDKIYEFYQAFDYFVFPSIYEGFGNALIEAQISGLFSFSSNSIPKEAFVSDKVINLSKSTNRNLNYWVSSILDYINNDSFYDRKISLELFQQFDIKEVTLWYSTFYNSLVNSFYKE
jgi:glycosyltransferase involved in cell wall biosynthesis